MPSLLPPGADPRSFRVFGSAGATMPAPLHPGADPWSFRFPGIAGATMQAPPPPGKAHHGGFCRLR